MDTLKNIIKNWGVNLIVVVAGFSLIFFALIWFQFAVEDSAEKTVSSAMVEINETVSRTIEGDLKSCEDLLKLQAKMLGATYDANEDNIIALLKDFSHDIRFNRLSFVSFDGKVYSSTFGVNQLESFDSVPNYKSDETIIGEPRIDNYGVQLIDVSTPVYKNDKKIGRLIATLDEKLLQGMYNANGLKGDAGLAIFSGAEGKVIATYSNRKLPIKQGSVVYDFLNRPDVKMIKGSAESYRSDVNERKSGWMEYEFDGNRIRRYYKPMAINDWYVSVTSTDKAINQQASDIRHHGNYLTVAIIILMLMIFTAIAVRRMQERKRISAHNNAYNIAIQKTNDVFCVVDLDSDKLVDNSKNNEKTVWDESPKSYSSAISQIANACTPEYRQIFLDTFIPQSIKRKMKEGVSSVNLEYKIMSDENNFRWISATVVPVSDLKGSSTKLICMENDITEQKLRQERLRLSATMDGLSGLYNRSTTEAYIDSFLAEEGAEGKHALLLIDIDYFKSVNDTLGHTRGDELISMCGIILRRIFRQNDIVGRVGGDEFVVLLKNYGNIDVVISKAKSICDGFRQEQRSDENPEKIVKTSASIGIALYGDNGRSFSELYKNADGALYASKIAGRDRFHFYDNIEI